MCMHGRGQRRDFWPVDACRMAWNDHKGPGYITLLLRLESTCFLQQPPPPPPPPPPPGGPLGGGHTMFAQNGQQGPTCLWTHPDLRSTGCWTHEKPLPHALLSPQQPPCLLQPVPDPAPSPPPPAAASPACRSFFVNCTVPCMASHHPPSHCFILHG